MAAVCNSWLLLQAQQIAACNAVHSADARFCRWLARASDVLSSEVIPVTQEAIAQALGIRRTTATLIAQQLQVKGAISYSRGRIVIRDRAALRAGACDCCHALGRARWPSELLRNGDGAS
jgi:CRP-like cAMP-binding protein